MKPRLSPGIEASALIRRAEYAGGFGTIIRKGDPTHGTLLLQVTERGVHVALLERLLEGDGEYRWQRCGPEEGAESRAIHDFVIKRTRFDADLWLIELDIAPAKRFIAETIDSG